MIKDISVEEYEKIYKKYNKIINPGKKHYNNHDIMKTNSHYCLTVSERSDGKTLNNLFWGLVFYWELGAEMAYIRRWDDQIRGSRAERIWSAVNDLGFVKEITKGQYDQVVYYARKWYLGKYDEKLDRVVRCENPFCYAFSISTGENDKSASYPNVYYILFDEFITKKNYIQDEFIDFSNLISTIIRKRKGVQIMLCANTINKYAPYFQEMGITKGIDKMQPGQIDIYKYGESGLQVAIERGNTNKKSGGKDSDVYFAFDNPKLKMITEGAWEFDIFPHLPIKYGKECILFVYFIEFNGRTFQCEIIDRNGNTFTYIHNKTTPIWDMDKELIFKLDHDYRYNNRINITKPVDRLGQKIWWFFNNNKVFYQDNEVGQSIENYLNECQNIK